MSHSSSPSKECEFFSLSPLAATANAADSMVILAAWCLVPGHPGFIFKENATLTSQTSAYEERKAGDASSSGENLA